MSAHRVTKTIEFCYGHRLLDYDGKCRYLHGHNGLVEVDIEADSLDERGMVIDFTEAKEAVKGWIDSALDHRMILSGRDPLVPVLEDAGRAPLPHGRTRRRRISPCTFTERPGNAALPYPR